MADGDGKPAGPRRSQTPASVEIGVGSQPGLVLARRTDPPGEPLDGQVRLGSAEPPRARGDDDLGPGPAEPLDRGVDGVRAEQAAARGQAALVRVERGRHARVERIRRVEAGRDR